MVQTRPMATLLFYLVIQQASFIVDGLLCYNCNNVSSPSSCYTQVNCSSGQNCFTEGITNQAQLTTFNLGCRLVRECVNPSQQSVPGIIGKRSTKTNEDCRQCCGVDECNRHLCTFDKGQSANECADDPTFDCIRTSGLYNLCADVQHARTLCKKFCGLCDVVDGKWSDWMVWSNCGVTCGQGQRSRTRLCNNPVPASGGADCVGDGMDIKTCTTGVPCPVPGQWTNWSPWGICSVTCGIGLERRDRTCSSPYPQYGGDYCTGDTRDDRHCFVKACADGGWNSWSSWDSCSRTCGTGLTQRHRQCTNPPPSQFGKPCVGESVESQLCFNTSCEVNGQWTNWSAWSSCTHTCGSGMRVRTRSCTNPGPSLHGRGCTGNQKDFVLCTFLPCPVHDCLDIQNYGFTTTGVYSITLETTRETVNVLCDMDTRGGGWTVFQNRFNGSVDFYANFSQYKNGFGDPNGEFWLGLRYVYELTRGPTELNIELIAADGSSANETFEHFSLGADPDYTLSISGSSRTIGDSIYGILRNNGYKFSTFDRDQDATSDNCAVLRHGGWWYGACTLANLNGYYAVPGTTSGYGGNTWAGMIYYSFKRWESLKSSRMMLRRRGN